MIWNLRKKNQKGKPPVVLMILDGFGLDDITSQANAITPETAPNVFSYMKKYPSTELIAHGADVGLFPGQEGNSEAGHLNIGAGRVVEQDLVRISRAITDGTFFKNDAFHQALFHAKKYNTAVHIMGLLTDGQSAHARPEHMYALLEYFRQEGQKKVFIHLFTDGRDSLPHEAMTFLKELEGKLQNGERIATIMGRFYAMDRNKDWERTEAAYDTLVLGKGKRTASTPEEAIREGYKRGETDEYIAPTIILDGDKPVATIEDNDVIFFTNARSDRARQITKAFVQKDNFQKQNPRAFRRSKVPKNIRFVAMTDFGPDLEGIFTAFPSPDVEDGLVLAIDSHRKQLYISETEKYAHVTYFFNGGYSDPINGEERELIHSPHVDSYALAPEMSAQQVTDTILSYLAKGTYDFITVNYPNADMLGHTGDIQAAKKGIRFMDTQIKRVVSRVLREKGMVIITADHGNAEKMIHGKKIEVMTQHTTNPVPFIVISKHRQGLHLKKGRLADIAPTVLHLLDLPIPKKMTGRILVE